MSATQVLHPSRAVVRTVFAVVISLAAILPVIILTAGLPPVAFVTALVAVSGAITRVLALPQVEVFLQTFVPWLSATPDVVAPDLAVADVAPNTVVTESTAPAPTEQ